MTITTRVCQKCGQEYQSKSNNQKYCCGCKPTVKAEYNNVWEKENRISGRKHRTCNNCGKEYLPVSNGQKWCKECGPTLVLDGRRKGIARFHAAHLEKCRLSCAKHRASKYDNTPINELLTSAEWLAILAEANGHCHYCDKEAMLTLDHVIPLSKGGKHSIDNVVPACKPCNCSKGARTPEQWLQSLITGGGSDASKSVREQSLVLEGD